MSNTVSRASLKRNWFTIASLVSRDFKLKYRRSTLGILWSVLNPLLMMCVLTLVFSTFFRFQIENYPLYVILGNVLFALMSESTTGAMYSILNSSSLIKKIRIEKLIFPLEKVLFQLVNFCISLIAVAIVMVFFHVAPKVSLVALPLLLLYVVLFSAGIGLALSALAVFFRDVCHLWGVVITAWTYATPLFYPLDILPEWAMPIMEYNPMFHYVTYFRDIVLNGVVPGVGENLLCLGMALVSMALGLLLFKKAEKKFILYV
ncbi:ABC transporter permease [Slackia sp.]|uniref:ABC transporter permease n=1 Tax=Slackia sp. TaxID=2049041 RepID=UPI002611E8C0|nr:ABC transporter permease [Slackia sp.]